MKPNETLYTAEQAAERLFTTKRTLQQWIKAGKLRAALVGRQHVIPESAIVEFINSRMTQPTDQGNQ